MPSRQERWDEAIASGGFPLDFNPDYPLFMFKAFVASRAPVPGFLCRVFPKRRTFFMDAWCRSAESDAFAWDETWRWIDDLVALGQDIPDRLCRFAFVPRPYRGRGRATTEARDLRFEYLVAAFAEEGLDPAEVWELYRKCFPNRRAKDPRNSYRSMRRQRSAWLAEPDGDGPRMDPGSAPGSSVHHAPPALPADGDWCDPVAAARTVLASECSPFLVAWHFWGERCAPYVDLWRVLAQERERVWVWDGLRELLRWLVYWKRDIPPPLRRFVREPRPKNPPYRLLEDARRLRVALVAHKLEELGHGEARVRGILLDALGESGEGVEETTVDALLAEGRDLIPDFLFVQPGFGPLPWES